MARLNINLSATAIHKGFCNFADIVLDPKSAIMLEWLLAELFIQIPLYIVFKSRLRKL